MSGGWYVFPNDPVVMAQRQHEREMEAAHERWLREDARFCMLCEEPVGEKYYDIYPDDRDGVICSDCFRGEMHKVVNILDRRFYDALMDAVTEYAYTL